MKIYLSAKCSDMCSVTIKDSNGAAVYNETNYVPDFIPNWCGDYVELEIDPKTGVILNWDSTKLQKINAKIDAYLASETEEEPDWERMREEDAVTDWKHEQMYHQKSV